MEAAIEAGADDVLTDDEGGIEVLCAPGAFPALKTALAGAGLRAEVAEIVMKPLTETLFQGDDALRMRRLLDALEGLDDVQEVYTNAVLDEVDA
jgi:transcriptional/translational regulatory protein YebC/TACO1